MSYKKIFKDEEWTLDGKDIVLRWSDNLNRFLISTKIPTGNPFNQPVYKKKIKTPFMLYDSLKRELQVFSSKSQAQRIVLEALVNSFFKDVEEQIKSL